MRPPQHPPAPPPQRTPAPRRRGPFLQPVSSSENVNERQGDASRVEASAEARSPWTWGAGSRGRAHPEPRWDGAAGSPRRPWRGRPPPKTASSSHVPAARPARPGQSRPRLGLCLVAQVPLSLHVRVGGPWACALCSCPGAPDQRGSGGLVEHPRGHVRSWGSASEGWR